MTTGPGSAEGERTFPRVVPRSGARHTSFAAYFTLRTQLGHVGVVATEYRVHVDAPPGTHARCSTRDPDSVATGQRGQVRHFRLTAPAGGWCPGRYTVTVFLERGPYCPPPHDGQAPPCPAFASQELDTGRAHFRVRHGQ